MVKQQLPETGQPHEQEIIKSLHYRLQQHQYDCSEGQVQLGLKMLALKEGKSAQDVALYLYWLLREGGENLLPEMFLQQIGRKR